MKCKSRGTNLRPEAPGREVVALSRPKEGLNFPTAVGAVGSGAERSESAVVVLSGCEAVVLLSAFVLNEAPSSWKPSLETFSGNLLWSLFQ